MPHTYVVSKPHIIINSGRRATCHFLRFAGVGTVAAADRQEKTSVSSSAGKSYLATLGRSWRLRCPRCGQEPLFRNWIRMNSECGHCHLHYEREPGYFLGSIYVNYGLTAVLVTIFYFTLFFGGWTSPQASLWIVAGFAVVFPLWFFRYARSIWMGFDHYWDPTASDKGSPGEMETTKAPRH